MCVYEGQGGKGGEQKWADLLPRFSPSIQTTIRQSCRVRWVDIPAEQSIVLVTVETAGLHTCRGQRNVPEKGILGLNGVKGREVVKSCWPGTSSPNRMFTLRSSELNIVGCQRFVYRVYKSFYLVILLY